MKYQDEFGHPDIFAGMMNYIKGMSRDIAILDVLGPLPEKTLGALVDDVQVARNAAPPPAKLESVKRFLNDDSPEGIDRLWRTVNGSIHVPENGAMARAFATARAVVSMKKLGSAAISSITDLGLAKEARIIYDLEPVNKSLDIVNFFL